MAWTASDEYSSSDEELRNEILKDIPTVQQVVRQLKYHDQRAFHSPGRHKKKTLAAIRQDEIRKLRRTFEAPVAPRTEESPFERQVYKDRLERLKQTVRSHGGHRRRRPMSAAPRIGSSADSSPMRGDRPPRPPRPRTANPTFQTGCSPLKELEELFGEEVHVGGGTSSPRVPALDASRATPASPEDFRTPRSKTGDSPCLPRRLEPQAVGNHEEREEEEELEPEDASEPSDKIAERMVYDYLQMEKSVSERVLSQPREGPKKLPFMDLPNDLQYHCFTFLDSRNLARCTMVSKSFRSTIHDALRKIFTDLFGKYPVKVPTKTVVSLLRRAHDLNRKKAAELFFWATAQGFSEYVRRIISGDFYDHPGMKGGLNVTSRKDDMTALHIACRHSQLNALHLLLAADGVDVNKKTKSGKHAITFAVDQGDPEVLHVLLSHPKVNPNATDTGGVSLLFRACAAGNTEIVEALLMAKADPNQTCKEQRTALFSAASAGYLPIVKILLEYPEVDMEKTSRSGKSPLYIAAERGHHHVVGHLLRSGANARRETCRKKNPLYAAAELGHVDVVRELLPFTVEEDLFKLSTYGTTPMFIASKHPNKKIKKMFVAFCMNQKKARQQAEAYMKRKNSMQEDSKEEQRQFEQKMTLMEDIDAALARSHDPNVRARTPRFAEHLEKFRDYHKDKAMSAHFEHQRRTRLRERLHEIADAADAIIEDTDTNEELSIAEDPANMPRPRSAGFRAAGVDGKLRPHVVSLLRDFDRDATRGQLLDRDPAHDPGSRPLSACENPFGDQWLRLQDKRPRRKRKRAKSKPKAKARKGIRRGSNFMKKRPDAVTRVDPRLNRMDKVGSMRSRHQVSLTDDEEKTPHESGGCYTEEQARNLYNRQKERIHEAQQRAQARINKEREMLEKQRADVKRRREKARLAAQRVSMKTKAQVLTFQDESGQSSDPGGRGQSSDPGGPVLGDAPVPSFMQPRGVRRRLSAETMAERAEQAARRAREELKAKRESAARRRRRSEEFTPPARRSRTHSSPEYQRPATPPAIATVEQELREAQILADEIKQDLAKAQNAGVQRPNPQKKSTLRFRANAKSRVMEFREKERLMKEQQEEQTKARLARLKKLDAISKEKRLGMAHAKPTPPATHEPDPTPAAEQRISPAASPTPPPVPAEPREEKQDAPSVPKARQPSDRRAAYNPDEYMVGSQRALVTGASRTSSGRRSTWRVKSDPPSHQISRTKDPTPEEPLSPSPIEMSGPLKEVARLERLAAGLESSCKTAEFEVRGQECISRHPSMESFSRRESDLAEQRSQRRKEAVLTMLHQKAIEVGKARAAQQQEQQRALAEQHDRAFETSRMKEDKTRRLKKRLENAYGVVLQKKSRRRRPRPRNEPQFLVTGDAFF